jgi:hypothetical protein
MAKRVEMLIKAKESERARTAQNCTTEVRLVKLKRCIKYRAGHTSFRTKPSWESFRNLK